MNQWLTNNQSQIGEGIIVQIDEAKLYKKNYISNYIRKYFALLKQGICFICGVHVVSKN